jgi:hypothetical protein
VTKPRGPATRNIVVPRPRQPGSPRPVRFPGPPRELRHGCRWTTIRYALDSNARTLRLCLILFVLIISPAAAAVITMLVRHILLRGLRARLGTETGLEGISAGRRGPRGRSGGRVLGGRA